jgi:hypothetical protein
MKSQKFPSRLGVEFLKWIIFLEKKLIIIFKKMFFLDSKKNSHLYWRAQKRINVIHLGLLKKDERYLGLVGLPNSSALGLVFL